MRKVFTYSPFIVVVSCKEATNEKIDTKVSKQGDSITKQVIQLLNLLDSKYWRYCDFNRTDFRELSSMEKRS
jgi:hypothetical protein